MTQKKRELRQRRASRVRYRIRQEAKGKLRLSVFRSLQNIYAQIIDDEKGHTIVSASTVDKEMKDKKTGVAAATQVGEMLAKRALKAGVKEVVFDRGGYRFHGRVAALAAAAREHGLTF